MQFYIELIGEAVYTKQLNFLVGAIAQFGEYLITHYPEARGLEDYQKVVARLYPGRVLFLERHLINSVISARNEILCESPDADRESLDWTLLVNQIAVGGYCLLSLLPAEPKDASTDEKIYEDMINFCKQAIMKRLSIPYHSMPTVLLDVDETATLSSMLLGEHRGGYKYNEILFRALRKAGIQNLYLFTHYDVGDVGGIANAIDPTPSHLLLIKTLLERGFYVHGVITPLDPFYQQGIGQYYLDHLFRFEQCSAKYKHYDPRQDSAYQRSDAVTNQLKFKLFEETRGKRLSTKGTAYTYLVDHVAPSILRKGFIFIDDRSSYLEEVIQAHARSPWLLYTIRCTPFLTEDEYEKELNKMKHQTPEQHRKRQEYLDAKCSSILNLFFQFVAPFQSDIDFACQGHGASLMHLANSLQSHQCGIRQDLGMAKLLYQLAIVYTEDEKMRAEAMIALQRTVERIEINYKHYVFDSDVRIQAGRWLMELHIQALWQRDAIVFYRLGLGYLAIAVGLRAAFQDEAEINKYYHYAANAFLQAVLQTKDYSCLEYKLIRQRGMTQLSMLYETITDEARHKSITANLAKYGIHSDPSSGTPANHPMRSVVHVEFRL